MGVMSKFPGLCLVIFLKRAIPMRPFEVLAGCNWSHARVNVPRTNGTLVAEDARCIQFPGYLRGVRAARSLSSREANYEMLIQRHHLADGVVPSGKCQVERRQRGILRWSAFKYVNNTSALECVLYCN